MRRIYDVKHRPRVSYMERDHSGVRLYWVSCHGCEAEELRVIWAPCSWQDALDVANRHAFQNSFQAVI